MKKKNNLQTYYTHRNLGISDRRYLKYMINLYSINLQLATLREHFCLSSGYSFRFIGHASVSDTLNIINIIVDIYYIVFKRTMDIIFSNFIVIKS